MKHSNSSFQLKKKKAIFDSTQKKSIEHKLQMKNSLPIKMMGYDIYHDKYISSFLSKGAHHFRLSLVRSNAQTKQILSVSHLAI